MFESVAFGCRRRWRRSSPAGRVDSLRQWMASGSSSRMRTASCSASASVHLAGRPDLRPGPDWLLAELVHLPGRHVVGDQLVDRQQQDHHDRDPVDARGHDARTGLRDAHRLPSARQRPGHLVGLLVGALGAGLAVGPLPWARPSQTAQTADHHTLEDRAERQQGRRWRRPRGVRRPPSVIRSAQPTGQGGHCPQTALAAARPAVRPEKRQPPRKVPSSAL